MDPMHAETENSGTAARGTTSRGRRHAQPLGRHAVSATSRTTLLQNVAAGVLHPYARWMEKMVQLLLRRFSRCIHQRQTWTTRSWSPCDWSREATYVFRLILGPNATCYLLEYTTRDPLLRHVTPAQMHITAYGGTTLPVVGTAIVRGDLQMPAGLQVGGSP